MAWELSASIDWAREIRGTYSIPKDVIFRSRRSAMSPGRPASGKNEIVAVPDGKGAKHSASKRLHTQYQVRFIERVLGDYGTSRLVRGVAEEGSGARSCLYGDLISGST